MPDADDLNEQDIVVHLVEDPVDANSHPVGGPLTRHGDAAGRARGLGKQIDGCPDPLLFLSRQRRKRFGCSPRELDSIGRVHTRPRSALTSSQGT